MDTNQEGLWVSRLFQSLGRPVAYYPIFASKLGGVTAAVMFCQLAYWYRNGSLKDGEWFYKSAKEMFEETGLTRCEQETARKKLEQRKVIETAVKGVPATMHYRIDWSAFEALWDQFEENQPTDMRETSKPVCGKPVNQYAGNQQTSIQDSRKLSIQETTGETTGETTREREPAAKDAAYLPLAEELAGAVKQTVPRQRCNPSAWARDIRLLVERDGATQDEIQQVVAWLPGAPTNQSSGFSWSRVILSGANLRKHFARLLPETRRNGYTKPVSEEDRLETLAAETRRRYALNSG